MNTARTLALTALAMASLPLLAQQPGTPASSEQQPTTTAPASSAQQPMAPSSAPSTATAAMSPVNGELVDKLDTKTAKTGDAVVIKTRSDVKTADGTAIPKGSKLVGKVVGVKPIGEGNENSQVALQFDHVELKGGQNLPVHAELQSLSTSDSDSTASSETMAPSPGGAAPSTTATTSASAPGGATSGSSSATTTAPATSQPQATQTQAGNNASAASAGAPAPGTIVARTGNIAIKTTSIPGVLLATNEPGQQDPRMAQSSGILLGPKHDVHLDSGTKVVVGVAASGAANPGGGN